MRFGAVNNLLADRLIASVADLNRHLAHIVAGLFDVDRDRTAKRVRMGMLLSNIFVLIRASADWARRVRLRVRPQTRFPSRETKSMPMRIHCA